MDNYSIQKKREEFWIELFHKVSGLNFKIKSGESPDCIIEYKSEKVGLEVADIFAGKIGKKGSLLKAKEQFKESILTKAKEQYISKLLRPIRLNTIFSSNINSNKIDPTYVSQILYEFLDKIKLKEWEKIRCSESSENWGNMSKFFSSLHILGLPNKLENYWTSIDFSFASTITKELLITAKREKEEKLLKIYKRKVSKNWLLLVSDGRFPSSNFDISNINIPPIKSGFNKMFLLLYPYNIVQELEVY